jgi:hypothetical protein
MILPAALHAVDNLSYIALKPGSAIRLLLWTSTGDEFETYADKDGWFMFRDVPPGAHVLTPQNTRFMFPEVRSLARNFR